MGKSKVQIEQNRDIKIVYKFIFEEFESFL